MEVPHPVPHVVERVVERFVPQPRTMRVVGERVVDDKLLHQALNLDQPVPSRPEQHTSVPTHPANFGEARPTHASFDSYIYDKQHGSWHTHYKGRHPPGLPVTRPGRCPRAAAGTRIRDHSHGPGGAPRVRPTRTSRDHDTTPTVTGGGGGDPAWPGGRVQLAHGLVGRRRAALTGGPMTRKAWGSEPARDGGEGRGLWQQGVSDGPGPARRGLGWRPGRHPPTAGPFRPAQ